MEQLQSGECLKCKEENIPRRLVLKMECGHSSCYKCLFQLSSQSQNYKCPVCSKEYQKDKQTFSQGEDDSKVKYETLNKVFKKAKQQDIQILQVLDLLQSTQEYLRNEYIKIQQALLQTLQNIIQQNIKSKIGQINEAIDQFTKYHDQLQNIFQEVEQINRQDQLKMEEVQSQAQLILDEIQKCKLNQFYGNENLEKLAKSQLKVRIEEQLRKQINEFIEQQLENFKRKGKQEVQIQSLKQKVTSLKQKNSLAQIEINQLKSCRENLNSEIYYLQQRIKAFKQKYDNKLRQIYTQEQIQSTEQTQNINLINSLILKKGNQIMSYNINNRNKGILNIQSLNPEKDNLIFSLQITDDKIAITGGENKDINQQIIFIEKQLTQGYDLINSKRFTQLIFDNKKNIYSIAGEDSNSISTNLNESFDISRNLSSSIALSLCKIKYFGSSFAHDLIFTFGGLYKQTESQIKSNLISFYDTNIDH